MTTNYIPMVEQWLKKFLENRGLIKPTKEPLYRYQMGDDEYIKLRTILAGLTKSGRINQPNRWNAALFVAYCAEWFRRESNTTRLKWDNLAPEIFPLLSYEIKQELTKEGLHYWGRPLRQTKHARKFLLTVALEGGFPVRILSDGAKSWLKDYLRAVIRRSMLLQTHSIDEIHSIAEEERERIRKTFQHDDFIAMCSELVASLIELRRKAESETYEGIRNTALLDAKYPGWRDKLPIYVPTDEAKDKELIDNLLNGLLNEKITSLTTDGVEVRRYLVKISGQWRPAVQLLADGEIPSKNLSDFPLTSRIRATAADDLGQYLSSEVALFEPPVGEQKRWRVRPLARIARRILDYPLASAVKVTLSSPEIKPRVWVWPKGDSLKSDVLVFVAEEGSNSQEVILRFLRSGSVSAAAKILYVLFPESWSVECSNGSAIDVEDILNLGCKLAIVTLATYFQSPENGSFRFRVEPNAEDRDQRLDLGMFVGNGFDLADPTIELVNSSARPLIKDGQKSTRTPISGELFVRKPGGAWSPLNQSLNYQGMVELSWRDPQVNIQIEKRKLALVPSDACIIGKMTSAKNGEIRLEGFSGWSADIHANDCIVEANGSHSYLLQFNKRPNYRVRVTLKAPAGHPFDIVVPLVGRDAVIALFDGSILDPGRTVDLATLRGAIAVSPQPTIIHCGAKGTKSGTTKAVVDGELPLAILRGSINETLASVAHQDGVVEIDFLGNANGPLRISRYRYEALRMDGPIVRGMPTALQEGTMPVARMILDPRHEHALECHDGITWNLPDRCKGLSLVYLRQGLDVVSRPAVVMMPDTPNVYSGDLISAMALDGYSERQESINAALINIGQGKASVGEINWLRDAITALNGLPATAFDVLKLLPSHPEALMYLLINARDKEERGIIWNLQNDLPFLWLALPLDALWEVFVNQASALINVLEKVLGKKEAVKQTDASLIEICHEIIMLEPAFEAIFISKKIPIQQTVKIPALNELVNEYVRDQHQKGDDSVNDLGERLIMAGLKIPPEIATKSHVDFAGLFAPVLLAASAMKKIKLDNDLALLARRTLREDPMYVAGTWTHLIKFYQ